MRPEDHEVVILGAGMSGLCMALQLQAAGRHDFVVLEQSEGIGGTWWDNRYPGAQVDVPAPAYAFSFAANTEWRQRFANASEIQAYQQALVGRHGLHAHLRLGTRLVEARFDEAANLWRFRTAAGDTLSARYFVCSTGPLSQPRWPDIPGLDDFRGRRLHSARWDERASLAGLRVGVIGTGSTAVQLIPPIAREAARLHVFQRTANWVLPRLERRYRWFDRWLSSFPPYARAVRGAWVQFLELNRRGFDEGTWMRRFLHWLADRHRRQQVADPALRVQLTPDYPLGCKRIIYSNDYYPTLAQSHVELLTAPIECITATGIRTTDGDERPLDALVCATGFDTVHLLSSLAIHGRGSRSLADAWRDGPEAYHGISVAGFPNMFLMLGPNTATGHTSTLLFIEPAVQHAIACMRAMEQGGHDAIEVRAEVQQAHNSVLQQRLGDSVWAQCRSWYRMDSGRVIAIFPGFVREYAEAVREPRLDDYLMSKARPRPWVIAHRGASALRPEHTLAAYELAIELGADAIEPDLVMTRDGVLVARHENGLSDTTDVAQRPEFAMRRTRRRVDGAWKEDWFSEDFSLAELKTLRARERLPQLRSTAWDGRFSVPTLSEIIELVAERSAALGRAIGLVPEIKQPSHFAALGLAMEQPLLDALAAHDYTRHAPVLIQSFEIGNLRALRERLPRGGNVRLLQLIGEPADRPRDTVLAGAALTYAQMVAPEGLREIAGYADVVCTRSRMLQLQPREDGAGYRSDLVDAAHAAGLQVMAYTFRPENKYLGERFRNDGEPTARNEDGAMRELQAYASAGLDGVFADDPGVARRALDDPGRASTGSAEKRAWDVVAMGGLEPPTSAL